MKKDDRVVVTGVGRTATWNPELVGTVTGTRGESVYVHWDETTFEDQMNIGEVKLAEEPEKKIRMGVEKQGISLQCGCWVEWTLLKDKQVELTFDRLNGGGKITRACPAHMDRKGRGA